MYVDFEAMLEPWLERWPISLLILIALVAVIYFSRKLPKSIVPVTLCIIAICQVIQVMHLVYGF